MDRDWLCIWDISPDTLLGIFNGTKFSIFRYRYHLLFETINYLNVEVADKRDIAAMKLAAVMGRGTKKDFIDLYFLSRDSVSLDDCLKYYDKKYGALADNLYSIIRSLTYFAEAEESEMPSMLEIVSWGDVKRFFENEAVRLADRFLKKE
ncbi:MAG: nucleotidyl transferase AbiEii/AbiGii toxin family protein [bacterium]